VVDGVRAGSNRNGGSRAFPGAGGVAWGDGGMLNAGGGMLLVIGGSGVGACCIRL